MDAGRTTDAKPIGFPWWWAGRAAGAALLAVAAIVFVAEVRVGSGPAQRACGSAWDAVAGRSGWSDWWAGDLTDAAQPAGAPLRTVRCPAAVNGRMVVAGVLASGTVPVVAAGELVGRRRTRRARPTARGMAGRLGRLGTALTIVGALLSAGGLVGLALLVADPRSTLFLYVSRPAVVLAGLLLVLPAVLLIALGRAAVLLADHLAVQEADGADA